MFISRAHGHFERHGYTVKTIYSPIPSGLSFKKSILHRVAEVHSAFADSDVKAIVCTTGGAPANELLPYLDYELIKQNPKIFVGFSDITVLHYAIYAKTGLRTFYGPNCLDMGEFPEPSQFTDHHFWHVLKDANAPETPVGRIPRSTVWTEIMPAFFSAHETDHARPLSSTSPPWAWLRGGKATGRLFGGCLTSIMHLAGTQFWPASHRGIILCIETSLGATFNDPLPITTSRQCLANLKNLGVFDEISGLVVGRPFGHDAEMRTQLADAIKGFCEDGDFPILMDVDFGHSAPNLTLPLNTRVVLDSESDEFVVLEPSVVE
jgi:muramoyltetrapeptide carboxypeptidase LdcA involved in peptidoglycan recycling